MPPQSTLVSQHQLIDIAKTPLLAFNDKNWDAVKAGISPDFVYDEVATHRKVQGTDQTIAVWQGWAAAFPDARATFLREVAGGNTVVFEVNWKGTHKGPLQTPEGAIAPTGKRMDVRACMVVEVADDKARMHTHYFDMGTLLQQIGAVS
jgi:steroid delta-isomerase-like uncharacterized protein